MDFRKVAVVIATHNRPAYLQRCANEWVASLPDYYVMVALVNHPEGARGFVPPPRCFVIQTGRIPEHAGCMAKTWNQAFQWGFRDPAVDWLICSMDDAIITPGWPARLAAHDADLYLAPAGDLVFMLNRRVLHDVGWFDERFPMIGWQEWDWQARAIRALGLSRVSLEDAHGWRHNVVGLSTHWIHHGGGAAPTTRLRQYEGVLADWFMQKWGFSPDRMAGYLGAGEIPAPRLDEINWYPWFPR